MRHRLSATAATFFVLIAAPLTQEPAAPPPLDPQRWQDQEEMTWKDYR